MSIAFFSEKRIFILSGLVFIAGLFINMGLQPFFLEEPRRVLISMEMVENQNLMVPTQLGQPYYKKPPVFNWVLIGSSKLFGGFSEWSARLPTVLSTLAIAWLLFFFNRKYTDEKTGWLSALLFIASADILFYFSTLAEIDLFFSLLTFAGIGAIFHFYQKKQWYLLFGICYALGGIGTLTKGLPSIVFTGLSLLVFFISQKDFRRLLSPAHFFGIAVFLFIVGGYIWIYGQQASLTNLVHVLADESGDRTMAKQGILSLISHFIMFPLQTLGGIMPAGLLLFFVFRKNWWQTLKQNPWIAFSFWMFIANFAVYWISPGARQRYIYMLYPFLINILVYFFLHTKSLPNWRVLLFERLFQVLLALLSVGTLVLLFIKDLDFLSYRNSVVIGFSLLFGVIFFLSLKQKAWALSYLILALGFGRILFDLTVLPQRAYDSGAQKNKRIAEQIHEIVQNQPLYIWKDGRFSFTTVVYLNLLRHQTLRADFTEPPKDAFYIVNEKNGFSSSKPLFEFPYFNERYVLLRWTLDAGR